MAIAVPGFERVQPECGRDQEDQTEDDELQSVGAWEMGYKLPHSRADRILASPAMSSHGGVCVPQR